MTNTIRVKQSAVAGKVPTTAQLQLGELAVNTTDGKLYLKQNVSGTESVVEVGGGGLPLTGGTLTGVLAVASGTVSAPGLTAAGDSNTGIFFPAADTIAIAEGGVEVMRVTADGRVGIGTTTPAEPFHVAGSARFGASASQTTGTAVIYVDGNNVTMEAHAGDNFQVKRNLLLQTYGGNVGIGTETAAVKLTITGTDAMLVPVGTTAQRPTGATGYFRYNSSLGFFEGYNSTEWVSVVGATETQTLTNKRVNPRIGSVASAATITPTADTADQYNITALATAATIAAPSGTPVDGQRLILRFEDNGTGRALTWTTSSGAYRAVGVALPTTTVPTKVTYVGCIYNAQDGFWDVIAAATQA
jgi:hypothetical protein